MRPAPAIARPYQNSLRLADHFHICGDCGRRQECDETGQLCGICEICAAVERAEEYDFGPMFGQEVRP